MCTHTELEVQTEIVSSVTFEVPGVGGPQVNMKSQILEAYLYYNLFQYIKTKSPGHCDGSLAIHRQSSPGKVMPPTGQQEAEALRHSPLESGNNPGLTYFPAGSETK